MTVDDKSPPNSWQQEMDRMPWKYKTPGSPDINEILARMGRNGMWQEARAISDEISRLKADLFSARERLAVYARK